MKPKDIKNLQAQSRNLRAEIIGKNSLVVTSRSNLALNHVVTFDMRRDSELHARCTCIWAQHGGHGCSHVMAALAHLASNKNRKISFWLNQEDAKRQRHHMLRLAAGGRDDNIWITTRPLA
jgi:hypothetical protein